jgi:hypothetical protein
MSLRKPDLPSERFSVKDALDFAEKMAAFELQRIDRMHVRFLWFIGAMITIVLGCVTLLSFFGYNNLRSLATEAAASQLHEEVKKQIDAKLSGENLPAIVHEEVRSYSANDLRQQVSKEINQGPVHDQILEVGKREAAALAKEKVAEAITPIEHKAQDSADGLRIQELVSRASTDDGLAFDELASLQSSGPSQRQELVKSEIVDISQRIISQVVNVDPRSSNLNDCQNIPLKTFSSSDVTIRTRAVIACLAWRYEPYPRKLPGRGELVSPIQSERRAVPHLFDVVQQDPSLVVRGAALMALNTFFSMSGATPATGIGLGRLDKQSARKWWIDNEAQYPLLLLLSRARPEASLQPRDNLDSIELYYELGTMRGTAPLTHQGTIDTLRAGMLEVAARPPVLPEFFGPTGQDPCKTEKDILNSAPPVEDQEERGGRPFDQLAYLQKCQPDDKPLSRLVEIATLSQSLARRHVATTIINTWFGTNQKFLDPAGIKDWLAEYHSRKSMH